MQHLLEGYRRFRDGTWVERQTAYEALGASQKPRVLVISCSDSRVDPEAIFDQGPGEIFAIRNVANLVPPYAPDNGLHGVSAALEYGVKVLKVETILVLGHSACGGCAAALGGVPEVVSEFVAPWLRLLDGVADQLPEGGDKQTEMERAAVRVSLTNLMSFPFVHDAVATGALALAGARFDIPNGALELLDSDTGVFAPA